MKRLLFTILSLLIFAPTTLAQDDNTAGWGLVYGSSQEAVRKKILKERGLTPFEEMTNKSALTYIDCTFAGEKAEVVSITFVDDAMAGLGVVIGVKYESEIFDKYDEICELMSEKYGDTFIKKEEYQTPYYKGDGFEISAIKQKKTSIMSIWRYPEHKPEKIVSVAITVGPSVVIAYSDIPLETVKNKRSKRKAAQDL